MIDQKNNNKISAELNKIKRKRKIVLIFYIIVMTAVWIGGIFVYKWATTDYNKYRITIAPGLVVLTFTQFVWRSMLTYLITVSVLVTFPFLYAFVYVLIHDRPKKRVLPLH